MNFQTFLKLLNSGGVIKLKGKGEYAFHFNITTGLNG